MFAVINYQNNPTILAVDESYAYCENVANLFCDDNDCSYDDVFITKVTDLDTELSDLVDDYIANCL